MTAARVLVIDDEAPIVDLVRGYLEQEGYGRDQRRRRPCRPRDDLNANPGRCRARRDAAGIDGFAVLRRAREFSDAYVSMLTARAEEIGAPV